jgi:hypothetical protein
VKDKCAIDRLSWDLWNAYLLAWGHPARVFHIDDLPASGGRAFLRLRGLSPRHLARTVLAVQVHAWGFSWGGSDLDLDDPFVQNP